MCIVLDKKTTARMFGVELVKWHAVKQVLIKQYRAEIAANFLGRNPDIGYCGTIASKQLCFKSRINKNSYCSDDLVSVFYEAI